MYACVAMCTHFEKKHYITRTFLICPTKASNDIFKNLKTLDKMKDVCDAVTRGHIAQHNIMREVKKDGVKYEADALDQKVYDKYGNHQKTITLKYADVLESLFLLHHTDPHTCSSRMTVRVQTCMV